jgi:hypothetical protein
MHRIVEVGSYPPPHAGNSVHLERLVDRLVRDGHPVTVIDPYAVQTCMFEPGAADVEPPPMKRRGGWWRMGRSLAGHACGNRVHFHMSAGRRLYPIARLLLWLTSGASRRILTIHSGSFIREFERLQPKQRRRAIRALRAFDDVICVNEAQRDFLDPLLPCRLHMIPAFLPCPALADPRLPADAEAVLSDCDAVILTSGSGEPVYDFATVLRGVESAQRRTNLRLGLIVATYKAWDPQYWCGIERALSQSSIRATVTRDLNPGEFSFLASRARIYVRGSRTDGDAIAIREAGAAGAQVIATDAVCRPEGTALFPVGNMENLADLLLHALADRDFAKLADSAAADNYAAIRDVYGLPQPVHAELAATH